MLPARVLALRAATGGEPMERGMVLPIAPMRVEDREIPPLERLPLDGAREIIQAVPPPAHERPQHDRALLGEGGAEHGRDRQENMPIDDALMEDFTDLVDPGVCI